MNRRRRELLASIGATVGAAKLAGCTAPLGNAASGSPPDPGLLASDLRRDRTPDVSETERAELVEGNTTFALALLGELVEREPDENLFVSPYSVSIALAMTWAGARGDTARQMAETLRFSLGRDRLHPAFNALDHRIDGADGTSETTSDEASNGGAGRDDGSEGEPFELTTVNAIWGLEDYPYREPFLDTLARNYGAGLRVVDFVESPDRARTTINDWIADRTDERIAELLPAGTIDDLTRLVLTNAIYFKANWKHTFSKDRTEEREFTALDGTTSTVPTMRQQHRFPYAEIDGHQAIELPYVGGDVGMVVVLPAAGEFDAVEGDLDATRLGEFFDGLEPAEGTIALPRFTCDAELGLRDVLSALGMPVAFDPREADFGGMADLEEADENLYISDAVHKSQIAVDEEGTEAAAATGVVIKADSAPVDPFEMVVDRPFLYCIRDRATNSVLFLGRVVDAAAAQ